MNDLYDALKQLNQSDVYPFHMPGHKRMVAAEDTELIKCLKGYDITEITGFDDLHAAHGLIRELEKKAAKLFDADDAFLLINGSSAGILAALSAVTFDNDKLLFARNSHKSAYNALLLNDAKPDYIWPEEFVNPTICGGINPDEVAKQIKDFHSCVYLTSPTYEGIISNIGEIAKHAHARSIPVIVDAAHGAHFPFARSAFEDCNVSNPLSQGADIAIVSLHKTLNAPTQTGLLLLKGNLIDRDRLKYFLSVYQSSSPSYILMAGIENCINQLLDSDEVKEQFINYRENLNFFYKNCESLNMLKVSGSMDFMDKHSTYGYDIGKLVISVREECRELIALNGYEILQILRDDYQLELEYASMDFALAMTSYMDSAESFERLYNALMDIENRWKVKNDSTLSKRHGKIIEHCLGGASYYPKTESVLSIKKAKAMPVTALELNVAIGHVCTEFIYAYPPGVPIVVPGEIITAKIVESISGRINSGVTIYGLSDTGTINVYKEG